MPHPHILIRLKVFFTSNRFFYLVVLFTLLAISLYPLYNKIRITPPGYVYTMAQYKIIDFYIYTAVMRQGHTKWLMEDPTYPTDQVIQPNLVNWFYILLGKLGFWLGIPDGWMYYVGMFGSELLLILAVIWLLRVILPAHLRRLAFLLIFLGGTWPRLKLGERGIAGGIALADVWPWTLQWESAFHRLTHVPSHLFAEFLVVVAIGLMARFMGNTGRTDHRPPLTVAFVAGILVMAAAIFFAPLAIPLFFAVIFTTILYFGAILQPNKWWLERKRVAGIALFLVLAAIGLFIIYQSINSGNPTYQQQVSFSVSANYFYEATVKVGEYLQIFWLLLPFILLSLPQVRRGWRWERLLIFNYFLAPFYLMFLMPFFGIQSWRMANSMPFVTGGILAVWGIDFASRRISKYAHLAGIFTTDKAAYVGYKIFNWGFVFLLLALSFPQNYFYYMREVKPLFTTQVYIPQAGVEALKLLGEVAPPRAVVLSLEHVGMIIPTYSSARPYGMKDYNERWFERGGALDPEIEAFYRGTMSEDQAREFLIRNRIKYVFYGWDELPLAEGKVHYKNLLSPLFAKDHVFLYETKVY